MIQELLQFISQCPTAFHAAAFLRQRLEAEGYRNAEEAPLRPGERYYWPVHASSLIAFRLPEASPEGLIISASHGDSPSFRVRDLPELRGKYLRLSVERYGGMLQDSWLDRPLSAAGRILVRTPQGLESRLVDARVPVALIPRVAIHLNREANNGMKYDPARDLIPLFANGEGEKDFTDLIASLGGCAREDLAATDLILYNPQPGVVWGPEGEFVSAPRLDGLSCVFTCADAFLKAKQRKTVPVFCMFDNEEIGSNTKQGAGGPWLGELLDQIAELYGLDKQRLLRNSMLISADNGHALHPNHPELSDPLKAPIMGQGVVIKHSPRYSTDGLSCATFEEICRRAEIPCQHYSNRPDLLGGGTLGNIAASKTPSMAVDIGVAQLAMHSSFETASVKDCVYLRDSVKACYETVLERCGAKLLLG